MLQKSLHFNSHPPPPYHHVFLLLHFHFPTFVKMHWRKHTLFFEPKLLKPVFSYFISPKILFVPILCSFYFISFSLQYIRPKLESTGNHTKFVIHCYKLNNNLEWHFIQKLPTSSWYISYNTFKMLSLNSSQNPYLDTQHKQNCSQ